MDLGLRGPGFRLKGLWVRGLDFRAEFRDQGFRFKGLGLFPYPPLTRNSKVIVEPWGLGLGG